MTKVLRRAVTTAAVAVTLVLGAPTGAGAQSVSTALQFLITNQAVQTGDFDRDRAAAQMTSETISRALLARLATLPVTTSSSSFLYRLNPTIGTSERATTSFGPFFVERAHTAGSHQASAGLTFQHLHFTSLDGHSLRNGTLVTTANQFADETTPFDVDRLTLDIDASVTTFYGSYGATDRLELGFAVPALALHLSGSRLNTYRGQTFTQATASATALGIGDVALRAKYMFFDEEGSQLAAAALVRLPTGRQEDLLGAGSASLKLSAIGSIEGPIWSAHVNGGFSLGGVGRELNYEAAVAVAATPIVTVSGELIGQWLNAAGEVVTSMAAHPRLVGVTTSRLLPDGSSTNSIVLVPGVKWNLANTWVVTANVSVPLTQAGLTAPATPFVGVDYTF